MLRHLIRLAWLTLLPFAAEAGTLLFQGTFSTEIDVQPIVFTVLTTEQVTVQSYGYAGGTVNSTVIAPGGFDPNLYIFAGDGSFIEQYPGSGCQGNVDPNTGNCDDPYIQDTFSPGSYFAVLSVADNTPVDSFLQDGFVQQAPFTCGQFGLSGEFCDVSTALGTVRTGAWALAITGADAAQLAPEPASWPLVGIAVAMLAWRRRCGAIGLSTVYRRCK